PGVDIWALGVTLFEAATGSLPFTGFADGRCPQLVDAAPRPGERAPLSAGLEALILQCLQKSPAQRPATMREIAERLRQDDDAALERSTVPLTPALRVEPASAPPRRRWTVRIATAAVVLAGASLATWRLQHGAAPPAAITTAPPVATATPTAPPIATPAPIATPPSPPPPAPAPAVRHPRSRHHAAHKLRSRVYGEKLD
ncbi:MAG: protein kinase, partial [Polyangia bacterium]